MHYGKLLEANDHIGSFYNKHYCDQWNSDYLDYFKTGEVSDAFNKAMEDLKDDVYSSIDSDYWPYITESFLSCATNKARVYKAQAVVILTVVSINARYLGVSMSYSSQQKVKAAHGGSRENAGRKKEEDTKQIRVPLSLHSLVGAMKVSYKNLNDGEKINFRLLLQDLIDNEVFIKK